MSWSTGHSHKVMQNNCVNFHLKRLGRRVCTEFSRESLGRPNENVTIKKRTTHKTVWWWERGVCTRACVLREVDQFVSPLFLSSRVSSAFRVRWKCFMCGLWTPCCSDCGCVPGATPLNSPIVRTPLALHPGCLLRSVIFGKQSSPKPSFTLLLPKANSTKTKCSELPGGD